MYIFRRQVFLTFLMMTSLVGTPALAKSSFKAELLKASNIKNSGKDVREKFISLMGKTFDDTPQKKVLVIGDSHAQDFINMVYGSGNLQQFQVKTRHIPTGCQLFVRDENKKNIDTNLRALCKKSDSLKKALPQIKQTDILILAANWKLWSAKELPETIKQLSLSNKQKLYVIGRKSFGRVNIRKLLRKSKKDILQIENTVDAVQEEINHVMESTIDSDSYVDFQDTICGNKTKCKIFTDDAHLITFDGGHLTKSGAAFLGKQLFEKTILKQLK